MSGRPADKSVLTGILEAVEASEHISSDITKILLKPISNRKPIPPGYNSVFFISEDVVEEEQ